MTSKRAIAILISIAFIALLLWHVDTRALLANFRATRWPVFILALLLFVPQILTIAWRWKRLVAPFTPLPLTESMRLVLAGATMNLLLPGKLGDLTKGLFLARKGHVSTPLGLGVVVFEKMLDVATLAVFMLTGVALLLASGIASAASQHALSLFSLLIAAGLGCAAVAAVGVLYFIPLEKLPGYRHLLQGGNGAATGKLQRVLQSSHKTMAILRERGSRRGEIIALSFVIWVLHLAQIYLFFASVNAAPLPGDFLCMIPLAIFVGLVPISLAGFGTRDAALVALLPAIAPSAVLAAAFYVNLRYILPAIAGLPFVARYVTRAHSSTSD
jgi:uncharacterized protein (TIRG00374 family)